MKAALRYFLYSSTLILLVYGTFYISSLNFSTQKDDVAIDARSNQQKVIQMKEKTESKPNPNFNRPVKNRIRKAKDDEKTKKRMIKRLNRLKRVCKSDLFKHYTITFNQSVTRFYYLDSPFITYCKVPKAGSTFWTRHFLQIQNNHRKSIFKANRELIHGFAGDLKTFSFSQKKASSIYRNSFNFLVSRDPYARLFSVYMDKYNLLGHSRFAKLITNVTGKGLYREGSRTCGYDVSFQDFLDFVADTALNGQVINRHWSPVYILCHPCDITYHALSKQETLSQDAKFIMNLFHISNRATNQLQDSVFQSGHKEESILSMIKMFFQDRSNNKLICPDVPLFLKKLWITFQSQGLIPKVALFPEQEIFTKGNNITPEEYSKIILNVISAFKITPNQRKRQRRRILVSHFNKIRQQTIEKLKHIYSVDFLLFDYSESPPS